MRTSSRRRGSIIYGMAGIMVVLGTMCALILLRSTETYRDVASAKWRLQALASAEGAAVALEASGVNSLEEIEVGSSMVRPSAGEETATRRDVVLAVDVLGKSQPILFQQEFVAVYTRPEGGAETWKLVAVESR